MKKKFQARAPLVNGAALPLPPDDNALTVAIVDAAGPDGKKHQVIAVRQPGGYVLLLTAQGAREVASALVQWAEELDRKSIVIVPAGGIS